MRSKEIAAAVSGEFNKMPPEYRAAHVLREMGATQKEVIDACREHGVPDPQSNATVNAMRNIELGLKPTRRW